MVAQQEDRGLQDNIELCKQIDEKEAGKGPSFFNSLSFRLYVQIKCLTDRTRQVRQTLDMFCIFCLMLLPRVVAKLTS